MKRNFDEAKADEPVAEEEIQVDFDFFNIQESDYLSIKHLLRQLFDLDNTNFNLAELTDFIINKGVGSTIKTDGEDSDPFSIFAVCEFDHPLLVQLVQYYIARTTHAPELHRALRKLFSEPMKYKIGFLFSERLLNMPDEVVGPLYSILIQELKEAGIDYDYILIPSRAYTEHQSKLDGETHRHKIGSDETDVYFYHYEDELMEKLALAHGSFAFETPFEETDSKRAFQEMGIMPRGYLTILNWKNFEQVPGKLGI